jgi:hypothetical protein
MTTLAERSINRRSVRQLLKQPSISLLVVYVMASAAAGLVHLILGADPVVVLLALGSLIVSVVPAALYGWRDMPALFCLIGGARYTTTALFWKLFELSPLDQGLYAPVTSFSVVLVGASAATLAAIAAHLIWRARPWFVEQINARGFAFLFVLSLFLVAATFALNLSNTRLLGGITKLITNGLILFPMAYVGLSMSTSRRRISYGLLLLVVAYFFISFIFNSRASTIIMLLSIFAMLVAYRYTFRITTLLVIAPLVVGYITVVSPAVLDARYYRGVVGNFELVGITLDSMRARLTGQPRAAYYTEQQEEEFRRNAHVMHYVVQGGEIAGRVVLMQELDYIVALAESQGQIGTERFWDSLIEILPSAIVSEKTLISTQDYPFWVYGVLEPGMQTNLEMSLYGSAYTYGGFRFLFSAVFCGFLFLFTFFRMFCPTFLNSIFAPFIVVSYGHQLTAGTITDLFSIQVRSLPFELLLFSFTTLISRNAFGRGIRPMKAVP